MGGNHRSLLVKLLCLERATLSHYNTYGRMLTYLVYQEEVNRLVGKYDLKNLIEECSLDGYPQHADECHVSLIRP